MSDRIYVATRKGLFTIERKANAATPQWAITQSDFLADNVTIVTPDPQNNHLYAALDHGHFGVKFHRSKNFGQSWEECATPTYPEPPDDYVEQPSAMSGKPIPWKLQLIWSIQPGGENEPGVLWCGTVPGGLFKSNDYGDSWTFIRSLWDIPDRQEWFGGGLDYPGIHSICVDPRNSQHVYLGISCGGVWFTPDGGETWSCRASGMRAEYMPPDRMNDPNIQDPHLLVQCRNHPDYFWTQHHNGVFRSTDSANKWHEITESIPSNFGFAVAVHPDDPDTAWFVPAIKDEKRIPVDGNVVVSRTRDGGKTFEILREGLPQQHAYDLTFRHALDIDGSGCRLAFGSTTGSLWITENQGDSWSCISNHLPPIHCVRFG